MTCISWTSQRHTVCGTRRWPRHKLPLWPSTKTDLCLQSSWQIAGVGDHHHHHQFEQNEGIIKLKKMTWSSDHRCHSGSQTYLKPPTKRPCHIQPYEKLGASSLPPLGKPQPGNAWEHWMLISFIQKTGDTSPVKVSYNITRTYITIFSDISLFHAYTHRHTHTLDKNGSLKRSVRNWVLKHAIRLFVRLFIRLFIGVLGLAPCHVSINHRSHWHINQQH